MWGYLIIAVLFLLLVVYAWYNVRSAWRRQEEIERQRIAEENRQKELLNKRRLIFSLQNYRIYRTLLNEGTLITEEWFTNDQIDHVQSHLCS